MLLNTLIVVSLILLIPTIYAAIIGAPLAITPKPSIKELIKQADIKPTDKFYELGAGTGRVMVEVAKSTGVEVIGFELSPFFYFITFLNLKIHSIKKYKLFLKDFFSANLREANIIFCFLMPKAMEKLKKKLKKELKPGTVIISYGFKIKSWAPYVVIKDNKNKTLPVYFYKI